MKKLQLMACISCIAIFLSSCASQYHPDLVGHYKPNTDVAKKQVTRQHDEITALANTSIENQLDASSNSAAPDLKTTVAEQAKADVASLQLTEKQQKKLDKVAGKINHQMEKASTKTEQQIQQKNFSGSLDQNKLAAGDDVLLYVILAILLPPLAVGLFDDGLTTRFWIDLILTLLFFIPGVIYALIVVLGG